ncbi:hypothetical protein EDD18DRAFT_1070873, partial [Armillaria luteobubalina]
VVGALLNWGLFGTLSVQLYLYYLAFPNDKRFIKYTVYGIYVIEFVQAILVAYDAVATFGYGFGDMDDLTGVNFYWPTGTIMNSIVSCVGQVFYAYRIFVVSKSRTILILIIFLSSISSVAAIITAIYSFQASNLTELTNGKTFIAVGIWCGVSALCDILITICMTYYLMRSTTTFRRTRILVTKIIHLTIETGSVTATVALLSFVFFIAFPHRYFYAIPILLMSKLYANSVYMVLNSRFRIIGGRDIYQSPTNISTTTVMIENITSQLAEGTRSVDRMQVRTPVIALPHESFDNDHELVQVRVSHDVSCGLLELIFPEG